MFRSNDEMSKTRWLAKFLSLVRFQNVDVLRNLYVGIKQTFLQLLQFQSTGRVFDGIANEAICNTGGDSAFDGFKIDQSRQQGRRAERISNSLGRPFVHRRWPISNQFTSGDCIDDFVEPSVAAQTLKVNFHQRSRRTRRDTPY